MLAREHRLHRAADFTEVVRRGRRASRPLLTVHLLLPPTAPDIGAVPVAPARAGLVVGKAVGVSVVRSTVSRRLRHLLRERIGTLPDGCRVVVRAAPAAAGATSAALGIDLDAALAAAVRPRVSGTRHGRQTPGRPAPGPQDPGPPTSAPRSTDPRTAR